MEFIGYVTGDTFSTYMYNKPDLIIKWRRGGIVVSTDARRSRTLHRDESKFSSAGAPLTVLYHPQ